ncbi:hypothetical protein DEI92_11855 [Curtobacterium sp. MCBD17_034]|nr:hypothetical protein DEI92_11855 [Curtobacterium sp. MCBD17_034]PZM33388.1 hypothetical protein DEI90_13015 [Curtobacterium sp. MCBD17_031]
MRQQRPARDRERLAVDEHLHASRVTGGGVPVSGRVAVAVADALALALAVGDRGRDRSGGRPGAQPVERQAARDRGHRCRAVG